MTPVGGSVYSSVGTLLGESRSWVVGVGCSLVGGLWSGGSRLVLLVGGLRGRGGSLVGWLWRRGGRLVLLVGGLRGGGGGLVGGLRRERGLGLVGGCGVVGGLRGGGGGLVLGGVLGGGGGSLVGGYGSAAGAFRLWWLRCNVGESFGDGFWDWGWGWEVGALGLETVLAGGVGDLVEDAVWAGVLVEAGHCDGLLFGDSGVLQSSGLFRGNAVSGFVAETEKKPRSFNIAK